MKINAIQVPGMVAAHADYLRGTAYETYAQGYIESRWYDVNTDKNKNANPLLGKQWCDAEIYCMKLARLFHITEPMFAVSRLLGEKLSPEETWSLDALPSPYGVIVFQKSIYSLDVWGAQTSYGVVSWSRAFENEAGGPGTLFNFYSDIMDMSDYYNVVLQSKGQTGHECGRWLWDHSIFVRDGESVTNRIKEEILEQAAEKYRTTHAQESVLPEEIAASIRTDHPFNHANEVLRTLFSAFSLMGETRMVDQEELTDRKLARRLQHKKHRPSPMVTVIQLRRPDHYGYHEADSGTWLTYRSWTAAHRRRVHYGPRGEQVKWIWINSYLRGPADAEIKVKARVTTLAK